MAVKEPAQGDVAVQPFAVDMRRLSRVGARPGFIEYLLQLWDYRHFIFYDARARVQSGTRKDRLGSAWLILNPLFNGLTYYLIFGLLLHTSGGIKNFIGYLVIGVFMFQLSSASVTNGARSIRNNMALVQGFNFPRAALPISANLRDLLANVPLLIVMLVIIAVVPPVEPISWRWVLIIPAVVLQFIFNLGVGMILARLIAKINDITHLLPFVIRVWMYASAVFYSFERFIHHPVLLAVMEANPLFQVLDIVRKSVLYAQTPAWQSWVVLTLWALSALVVGMFFFFRGEEKYGRS